MIYELILSDEAKVHVKEWLKSGQKITLKKIAGLFEELRLHPTTGTGHVEQLKGNLSGLWSRQIDKGHRLIYGIENDKIIVDVVSLKGHFGDK